MSASSAATSSALAPRKCCRASRSQFGWVRPNATSTTPWPSIRRAPRSWWPCVSGPAAHADYPVGRLRFQWRLLRRKGLQHRFGARPYPAPKKKRFGGLLDQHAPALGRAAGVERARPQSERRVTPAVGHVVAESLFADEADRHLRHLALQARGRRIDDEVVWRALQLGKGAALDLP